MRDSWCVKGVNSNNLLLESALFALVITFRSRIPIQVKTNKLRTGASRILCAGDLSQRNNINIFLIVNKIILLCRVHLSHDAKSKMFFFLCLKHALNVIVQSKVQSRCWVIENKALTIATNLGINFLLPKESRTYSRSQIPKGEHASRNL